MYQCVRVCECVCVRVGAHLYVRVSEYRCVYACVFVYMSAYVSLFLCTGVCLVICVRVSGYGRVSVYVCV